LADSGRVGLGQGRVVFQLTFDGFQEQACLALAVADEQDVGFVAVEGGPEGIGQADPGGFGRAAGSDQSQATAAVPVQILELTDQPVMEEREAAREVAGQIVADPVSELQQRRRDIAWGPSRVFGLSGPEPFQTP
jgi:hypothetical protein